MHRRERRGPFGFPGAHGLSAMRSNRMSSLHRHARQPSRKTLRSLRFLLGSEMTTWLDVVGYEGHYMISDDGKVFSLKSNRNLAIKLNDRGYPCAHLSKNGIAKVVRVHRIMALAFLGPCPIGLEVLHKDENPLNCVISNIKYGTRKENAIQAVKSGRHHNANKTHCPRNHEYAIHGVRSKQGHRYCKKCRRLDGKYD